MHFLHIHFIQNFQIFSRENVNDMKTVWTRSLIFFFVHDDKDLQKLRDMNKDQRKSKWMNGDERK